MVIVSKAYIQTHKEVVEDLIEILLKTEGAVFESDNNDQVVTIFEPSPEILEALHGHFLSDEEYEELLNNPVDEIQFYWD